MTAIAHIESVDVEAAARRELRAQIARLEKELSQALAATYPPVSARRPMVAHGGPRLLGLEPLERTRDTLAARVSDVRRRAGEQRAKQAEARARLAAMLQDPPAHKGERVSSEELGLPGCTVYAVRPRLGPVGVLTNWWRVKVSSGCPLPQP
jgi:hypothetical protein